MYYNLSQKARLRKGRRMSNYYYVPVIAMSLYLPILNVEKYRQPLVTALADMVRHFGDDETGEAGHKERAIGTAAGCQQLVLCPRNYSVSPELLA